MKVFWYQFLCLFFHYFFFFILDFPFFCYLLYLYLSFFLWFLLFLFFVLSLLVSFLPLPSFLPSSAFAILTSLALASTALHTLLDTSLSLLFLFSSQFQDYGEPAMAFPKLHSIFVLLLYQFLFFLCALSSKYLLLLYVQLNLLC